jgi:hypothetical protein
MGADLEAVVREWPRLSLAIRAGILAMIQAAANDENQSGLGMKRTSRTLPNTPEDIARLWMAKGL